MKAQLSLKSIFNNDIKRGNQSITAISVMAQNGVPLTHVINVSLPRNQIIHITISLQRILIFTGRDVCTTEKAIGFLMFAV